MAPLDKSKTPESIDVLKKEEDRFRTLYIRERTLFGSGLGVDLMKKPPLNVVIDLGKDSRDFLHKTEEMDAKFFERFVEEFSANFGIPKDKLLTDPEFRDIFLAFKDSELDTRKRRNKRVKYSDLKDRMNLKLIGFVPDKSENTSRFCNSYLKIERDRQIAKRISALAVDTTDPNKLKIVGNWRNDLQKLEEEYRKGLITEEQYLVKRDAINEKAVKESGDKDLQELWKDYKDDEIEIAKSNSNASNNNIQTKPAENLITDKEQVKDAFNGLDTTELHFDLHNDGTASVAIGREKFPMEISVYKDTETNKYVYYIADKYADNGLARADSGNLMTVLDQRYLDSFISSKIGAVPEQSNSSSEISDQDVILLAEHLIGSGKDRGYRIIGEDREVFDLFMPILTAEDDIYPTYYAKIKALNKFFEKEDNVASTRRAILAGKVYCINDLLGDKS